MHRRWLILACLLVAACSGGYSSEDVDATVAASMPTPLLPPTCPACPPMPTQGPQPTARVVVVTATATVTPEGTPRPTVDHLTAQKTDGFYTVGREIAPGLWESLGTGRECYWARRDSSQDTIDNHYGMAGGTVRILPSDYEVEFDGCGMWVYLGP
jgi:hypothetical protein